MGVKGLTYLFLWNKVNRTRVRWQIASPACTELEVVVMDWLAKLLDLPENFLSTGKGQGVIQVYIDSSVYNSTEQWREV